MTPKKADQKSEETAKRVEDSKISQTVIDDEMKASYLDYAMSVIIGRALPDVRDGLKPVHRRILYAMNEIGLKHTSQTKKSARIVGEVLGKYHPHGDSAVYDAMVRMAQDFSLRYPLVIGQGNFGCFTKDTEVALADGRKLSFEELIKEHNAGKENYAFTIDGEKVKIARIIKPRLTIKDAKIMKVVLDNGEELRCTLNHKFLTKNGDYKEASQLRHGDSLMPLYSRISTKEEFSSELAGYSLVLHPGISKWEFAHNLADEYNLEKGIYAKSKGRVRHHKDFNKSNNDPTNVERLGWAEHFRLHAELVGKRHATDPDYVKKLALGRKIFWSEPKNKDAMSKRTSEKNLKNWQDETYRAKMKLMLSKVNKEHIRKHPELRKTFSSRATATLTKLWKDPIYREKMKENIIKGNKNHITNKTGRLKFLKICKAALENEGALNEHIYEHYRAAVYPYGAAPTWNTGFNQYYYDKEIAELVDDACSNHKVASTEILDYREDVYDLTIDKTHNFALAAGVFVHNSVDGDNPAHMRYCITGDSLVATDKGLIPISDMSDKEEAKINLKIISMNGIINHASKFFNSGKHKTIKITTAQDYEIEGSFNHPLLTWKIGSDYRPMLSWKTLEDIEEGDVVLFNRNTQLFSEKNLDLSGYHPKTGFKNDINLPKIMDEELAFLLGALVSEGSFHNKQILFNNSDAVFYDEIKRIIKKKFSGIQIYERKIKGGCTELSIYEQKVVQFLENIGLKNVKADKKDIPFSVLTSKKSTIQNFLKGLYEGDGSINHIIHKAHAGKSIEISYTSKSRKLVKQLKIVLLSLGIVTNSYYFDKRNACLKLLITTSENAAIFEKEIGFFSQKKKSRLKAVSLLNATRLSRNDFIPFISDYMRSKYSDWRLEKYNFDRYKSLNKNKDLLLKIADNEDKKLIEWLIINKYLFLQVKKKEFSNKENTVYSIKVDSSCHSFVANGFINHNTEAKLAKISDEMLQDIDKETVKFIDNFDGSLQEPEVLPSKIPNLLINGSSGIAVGMATNIPPHNIKEVCSAVIDMIENPDIEIRDIIKTIKGPDFPTGGTIIGRQGIFDAYTTGRGSIDIKAKMDVEDKKDRQSIIITEIPYQLNKSILIEQMAQMVNDKIIQGVSDIRDESDRKGMRIVIELKKSSNIEVVKNHLYKHTRLHSTFGAIMLALKDNQPKTMNIKEFLDNFLHHRQSIVRKRIEYDLRKSEEKDHILLGLLIALEHLDAIIKLIKSSKDPAVAKKGLVDGYKLTEVQSQAILDMKLQRLTGLEQQKIKDEHKELLELIKKLKEILADEKKILHIIKDEMKEIIHKYGDERKTVIEEAAGEELEMKDFVKPEDNVITISHAGYAKRQPLEAYKTQRRGGKGVIGATTRDEDFLEHLFIANTHSYLLVFTDKGKVHWLNAYEIPEAARISKGKPIINLVRIEPNEKVQAVIPVSEFNNKHFLLFATKKGLAKKTNLEEYSNPRQGGIIAISLNKGDEVIDVVLTDGKQQILIATKEGQAVKFSEEDVRCVGRASCGVRGIKLADKDEVIGMILAKDIETILTVTENGYGKRSQLDEYRFISRGGKGVRNIICSDRNGKVVSVNAITDHDDIMLVSKNGIIIRIPARNINVIGRNTQGVKIMKLEDNDKVVAVTKIEANGNGEAIENKDNLV